ncbi:hypothetical protein RD792_002632 [Penstemon davidsonii]|uniref:Defensin-like protein n=1 Tax=Penstemon davidsonii TaxID=160366 RepID=A0ABR0DRJ0_9LAMI|nr:hypothetical protein RD792_002632 [Penstemon davidsonii]
MEAKRSFWGLVVLFVMLIFASHGSLAKRCASSIGNCKSDHVCAIRCKSKGHSTGICWFQGPNPRVCICEGGPC